MRDKMVKKLKIIVDQQALLQALEDVTRVVKKSELRSVNSCVLIEARTNGDVLFTGFRPEFALVIKIQATVLTSGIITVPAHMLYAFIRTMPQTETLEIDALCDYTQIYFHIRTGDLYTILQSWYLDNCFDNFPNPVRAYSNAPKDEEQVTFSIPSAFLTFLSTKLRFAMSTDKIHPYLNGIYLHIGKQNDKMMLRAAATDGHRLVQIQIPAPEQTASMPGVIIHRKVIKKLYRLLEDCDDTVKITVSKKHIFFEFSDTVLFSKPVEGVYPDYERVIPTDNDKIMRLDPGLFAKALDRAKAVMTDLTDKNKPVKLALSKNNLTSSVGFPGYNAMVEKIPTVYAGEALEISFNVNYLRDITAQIESDMIEFALSDANKPILIRDPTSTVDILYVLLPLRF